jgi:flagellum-specific peptidoglycan hydrolase FlgJ
MDPAKRDFITRCSVSARMVGHPFPNMAGCEAALESQKPGSFPFQLSTLAMEANNVFGMKVHQHNEYGEITFPTREYLGDEWVKVDANFERYPTLEDCFADRLKTLMRLSPIYPHYKAALDAQTAEEYVTEVSKSWSTDPGRAAHCIQLYREYMAELGDPRPSTLLL